MRWRSKLLLVLTPAAIALAALVGSDVLPMDDPAIQYTAGPVDDPAAALQTRLDNGQARLKYDEDLGYLPSLLKELHISTKSQILVFSKTSFQSPRISPRMPRAVYFGDNIAVGFVRTGDVLEVASLDSKQGIHFYTVDQSPAAHPQLARRDVCLQCHVSSATLGIPGLMIRSVVPDRTGAPVAGAPSFITDHRSPLKERWGGWYVTGTTGDQLNMGNMVTPDELSYGGPQVHKTQNITDLNQFFDTGAYLTPHSDVVALMTLEHQTQMDNLMIRIGWETRLAAAHPKTMASVLASPEMHSADTAEARLNASVEQLTNYMLFNDEATLTSPVKGTSGFREEFEQLGPRDSKGRSLRDFDLQTRMFRYPCSFMIYSAAFDGMPQSVRDRLYRRLWEVLSLRDNSPQFAHLSPADRKAILEILVATKSGLPAYWHEQPPS
jgi:hypothetical protein